MQLRYSMPTKKDVRNEGRTDYMHENTGPDDKMYSDHCELLDEITRLAQQSESAGVFPNVG